ncbi:MAG: hypothetical protein ABJC09_03050 [Terriglobia bacterium]
MREENLTRADLIRTAARQTVAQRDAGARHVSSTPASTTPGSTTSTASIRKLNRYLYYALGSLASAALVALAMAYYAIPQLHALSFFPRVAAHKQELPRFRPSGVGNDPRQEFSRSMSRLADALAAQWPKKPEQVLRDVAAQSKDCAFAWNNGQPALMYGAGKTMSASLDRCSDAVENYRRSAR